MIPIYLTIEGFLSYQQPANLDFASFDLACISGQNGAGKSSLLDAITWSLFGQARKRDDSVINLQSKTAQVVFTFEHEGNIYRVQRMKAENASTALEFQVQNKNGEWKALTERTMRATEALIQKTLHLDYETFINASFFLQGNADQFTQQRPGDRKRILSSILGLEVWEEYRKTSMEARKIVETQVSALDGRMLEIKAELAEEDVRRSRLKELEELLSSLSKSLGLEQKRLEEMREHQAAFNEQRQLVETLKAQFEKNQQRILDEQIRLTQRLKDRETYQQALENIKQIKADYKAWETSKLKLEEWEGVAAQFNDFERKRRQPLTDIETVKARLETEVEQLQQQYGQLEEARKHAKDSELALKTLETQLEALQKRQQSKTTLLEKREALERENSSAVGANPLLREEMDTLKARIEGLSSSTGAECPLCGQPLSEEERIRLIGELEAEGKEKGDRYRNNQQLLKDSKQEIEKLNIELSEFDSLDEEIRNHERQKDQLLNQAVQHAKQEADWENTQAKRLADITEQLASGNFAQKARQVLKEIDQELVKIGYQVDEHDQERAREKQLRGSVEALNDVSQAQSALAPLEREIEDLEGSLKLGQAELQDQSLLLDNATARLAAASAGLPQLAELEKEMLSLQEKENKARLEVGAAKQAVEVLKSLKERQKTLTMERETLIKQVALHKNLERAFGKNGVPAMLIEQALPQIELRANQILEKLSGGAMTITFSTQAEYKDNKRDDLRETLDIIISDQAGQRDYEMYSGGEAFRINFAIRLALSEILAQRAGARLQTLVIDEGFGSQDEMGRQRLIQAINMVKDDFEKILVITHIEALKEAFPTRIEIEKTPSGSQISVF